MELFLVSQNCVAVLACADAPRVDHVAHEDAPITDFARVCHLQDDLHRRLHELVAAHDGQCHTFNRSTNWSRHTMVSATRSITSVEYCTPR